MNLVAGYRLSLASASSSSLASSQAKPFFRRSEGSRGVKMDYW